MSTTIYTVVPKKLPGDWGYVCRKTVINPLVYKTNETLTPQQAYDSLYKQWRARAWTLMDAGWLALKSDLHFRFACNCPPVGVVCAEAAGMRPCRHSRVCPMCFGRFTIREPYDAVRYACFDEKAKPRFEGLSFVAFRRRWYLSGEIAVPEVLADSAARRAYETTTPGVLGACVVSTIEPNTKGNWKLARAGIMLVPNSFVLPDVEGPLVQTQHKVMPADKVGNLVEAAAFAFRYPTGMMRGDVAMTVALLNGAKGKHQILNTGMFRNTSSRVKKEVQN